jgi:acetyl-CoA synthetase
MGDRETNVEWLQRRAGVASYRDLHAWSVTRREEFWQIVLERLGIRFRQPWTKLLDLSQGIESPQWLVDARLNIVDSCFQAAPGSLAIVHQREGGDLQRITVGELESLANRAANGLMAMGLCPGDAVAVVTPMSAESVAFYLGAIKAGCVIVSIPDSFSPNEIATRLRLGGAKAVFTQDVNLRGGKELPLYANVIAATELPAIVVRQSPAAKLQLRKGAREWDEFLSANERFDAVARQSDDPVNILFSSGTTGDPKAIPWTQITPIKCAMDGHFHQDVHAGDVLVWPTNLGWMMGPWLIFAALLNRASIGLFHGAPTGRDFGRFIEQSHATMLGVVPSLVKAWRATGCLEGLNWSGIRVFSNTGECSNADDMRWLMEFAGGKPVVEYCGGTEIGGGYITSVITEPCGPACFNTPALGLDLVILDEDGEPAENGEVFLIGPSIGLSNTLLNQSHHDVYFAGAPRPGLRRHGDQIERLPDGGYRAHGRVDDTMNLGGIKVSSAEIERAVRSAGGIEDVAAVAVPPPGGGPSQLVIFAVSPSSAADLRERMQQAIRRDLSPLFKIHDLVLVDSLPRTASNKVMRRVLRDRYSSHL